jgi:Protein of unknown function (DUF2934)
MTTVNREDTLRSLAYKFWEEEGCPEGRAEAHWLRAVAEFKIPNLMVIEGNATPAQKAKKR